MDLKLRVSVPDEREQGKPPTIQRKPEGNWIEGAIPVWKVPMNYANVSRTVATNSRTVTRSGWITLCFLAIGRWGSLFQAFVAKSSYRIGFLLIPKWWCIWWLVYLRVSLTRSRAQNMSHDLPSLSWFSKPSPRQLLYRGKRSEYTDHLDQMWKWFVNGSKSLVTPCWRSAGTMP